MSGKTLTRADLAEAVFQKVGLPRNESAEIVELLKIPEGTVKSHVKRILRKLRVDNRAGAVARYLHLIQRAGR